MVYLKRISLFVYTFLCVFLITPIVATAETPLAGSVTKLSGSLVVENGDGVGQMSAGQMIRMQDLLRTGNATRADLRFLDGSIMTLGDNAVITIDDLVYNPAESQSSGAIQLIKGTFHMISGKIAKSDGNFTITTAVATIGIRGTDFIVLQNGDRLSVLLLDDGEVTVSNSQSSATLDAPGEGIDIVGKDSPVGPVKNWAQDRIDAAVTAVSW